MELGSNYELDIRHFEEISDTVPSYLSGFQAVYLDSGRSAGKYLLPVLPRGVVLMPDYICQSVVDIFRNDFEIQFYRITSDFSIDMRDLSEKMNEKVRVVYIMNYFGMVQPERILQQLLIWKEQYHFTLIEDTTHSLFSSAITIGDYCICSLRKWLSLADGGVVYSKQDLPKERAGNLQKKMPSAVLDAMILKHWFLEKQIDCNSLYRSLFAEEELKLDEQQNMYRMSDVSKSFLNYYSVKELSEKRMKNAKWLARYFKGYSGNNITPVFEEINFVPFTFPVYAQNRDELRSYLMEHQIYCAVHWPLDGTGLCGDTDAEYKAEHLLSLPIDQRYGEEHMTYLCQVLDGFEG